MTKRKNTVTMIVSLVIAGAVLTELLIQLKRKGRYIAGEEKQAVKRIDGGSGLLAAI